ncbi:MAG: hypothetical protein AABZ31_13905 [Bdellovibrionota bacterium]
MIQQILSRVLFLVVFAFVSANVTAAPLKNFTGNSIEEVKQFIVDNNILTLEQFLPTLPVSFRSNFVLMRQSNSLQPTRDPLQPRAIMFGDSARIVFAFNGIGESIEMMEKPVGSDRFLFSRLNFNGKTAPTEQKNCLGCHLSRPLWGQYRHWNGMYGGDQDIVPKGSLEELDYFKFARLASASPLYGNLIFKCGELYEGLGMKPGYVERNFAGVKCQEVSDLLKDYTSPARLERRMQHPAEGLGELLNRQNADRVFAIAKKSPNYLKLHRLYVGNAIGCFGERVFDLGQEQEMIVELRKRLASEGAAVQKIVNELLVASPTSEITLQAQMLHLLGLNVDRDIRLDLRTPKKIYLGNDCDVNSTYSPGSYCGYNTQGYPAFSDGYDMGTNLLGYQIIRDLYKSDSEIHDLLRSEFAKLKSYFESLPPDSGEGYENVKDKLFYLNAVIEHLNSSSKDPADIPKYIQNYPFIQLLKLGNGFGLCQLLASE